MALFLFGFLYKAFGADLQDFEFVVFNNFSKFLTMNL
jgi:hypothetical protein